MDAPYYIVPTVEAYRQLDPKSEKAKELSRIIAANIGDYASLRLILGIDPPEFARFYPDMETNTPSTLDTIDTFLEKYKKQTTEFPGESMPYNIEMDLWDTQSIPGPQENLSEETEEIKERGIEESDSEIVERSREEDREIAEFETVSSEEKEGAEMFSRLIKSKRYEEALVLIERQNLNNPRKSIYFAHQMRFLKKLIAIENYKTKQKG